MAIVQAKNKKQYAIEAKPLLRILASGLKLTDESMSILGLSSKTKDAKGSHINYGVDDETGKVFVYKAEEGPVLGQNKTFTSTGLKSTLLKLAKGASITTDGKDSGEVVSEDTAIKGGLQIRFEISSTPTVEGGVSYHEVCFKEAVLEKDAEEEENTKATPASVDAESNF